VVHETSGNVGHDHKDFWFSS